jgi:secreted trypsin-like serine protease
MSYLLSVTAAIALICAALLSSSSSAAATPTAVASTNHPAVPGSSVRVVRGQPVTDRSEYAFVVDLSLDPERVSSTRFCTGTLIRSNVVLTAAHCVLDHGELGAGTYATVGRVNIKDGHADNDASETFHAGAAIVHPSYSGLGSSADVALLLLEGSSSKPTVRLATTSPHKGTETEIVGYGITALGTIESTGQAVEVLPTCLQKTSLVIETRSFCNLPSMETEPGMLCTAGLRYGSSACRGDSGGGLFTEETPHNKTQVGVVSYGDAMCLSDDSGVFTDVASVRPWIRDASEKLQALVPSAAAASAAANAMPVTARQAASKSIARGGSTAIVTDAMLVSYLSSMSSNFATQTATR